MKAKELEQQLTWVTKRPWSFEEYSCQCCSYIKGVVYETSGLPALASCDATAIVAVMNRANLLVELWSMVDSLVNKKEARKEWDRLKDILTKLEAVQ
jgi:hypothetical protein